MKYIQDIARYSKETLTAIERGEITAAEGAKLANAMRNKIMETARLTSSDFTRAYAQSLKKSGQTLAQAEARATKKLFSGKTFAQLTPAEQGKVYQKIIEASGTDRLSVTKAARRLDKLGRALIAVGIVISIYNIATAENKRDATAREAAKLVGGVAGGAATGALMGLACGPGAPVCVGLGVLIGGVLGAMFAEAVYDYGKAAHLNNDPLDRRPAS